MMLKRELCILLQPMYGDAPQKLLCIVVFENLVNILHLQKLKSRKHLLVQSQ